MQSRALVGRARRLTDTSEEQGLRRFSKDHHAGASTGQGIGASTTSASEDFFSVVGCFGGGLEGNRSCNVGNIRVTYSVHTHPGADPGGKTKDNQDAWAVKEQLNSQHMLMLGVFDGHGAEGKVVSNHIATNLHKILARSALCKSNTMENCLSSCFPEANHSLRRVPGLDLSLSGSTGIVTVVTGNKQLVVANLGDSRAVTGRLENNGTVVAIPLSSDHTPMDPSEAQRINASGGRIASFMYNDEPLGPPRVWLRDVNVPGLCMTRSFGDSIAASVGVLDTPDVITYSLKPEDRYLVLMSDGIFEFMDSQEVVNIVHNAIHKEGHGPNEAAKRLVKEARRLWQSEEEDIIDDCTAMVVCFSPVPASQAAHASSTISAMNSRSSIDMAANALAGRLEGGLKLKNATSSSNSIVSKPYGPGSLGYKRS